ncbi:hypothetical protein [Pseudogracilibacillus sp. SO30301A]|uniref:hypothetical protein n=1 Tax=Pseudogracilibacillus sp. SO30301A TaxID=3098291 RepID=UPI00300E5CAA
MKKAKLILLTLIIFGAAINPIQAKQSTEIIPQNQPPTIMELAFLRFLGNTILEVMYNHGDNQLFMAERIEKITQNVENDTYDITLHVIGFEGAHNPPYKLIQMTIRIPGKDGDYEVINYKSRIISGKEFKELSDDIEEKLP